MSETLLQTNPPAVRIIICNENGVNLLAKTLANLLQITYGANATQYYADNSGISRRRWFDDLVEKSAVFIFLSERKDSEDQEYNREFREAEKRGKHILRVLLAHPGEDLDDYVVLSEGLISERLHGLEAVAADAMNALHRLIVNYYRKALFQNQRFKVFISYSHDDRDYPKIIAKYIAQVYDDNSEDNFKFVWYDEDIQGGSKWPDEIKKQIAECDILIFICSNSSLKSKNCQQEYEQARQQGKAILPIIIRRRTVPFLPKMDENQWIDFKDGITLAKLSKFHESVINLAQKQIKLRAKVEASQQETERTFSRRKLSRMILVMIVLLLVSAAIFAIVKVSTRGNSSGASIATQVGQVATATTGAGILPVPDIVASPAISSLTSITVSQEATTRSPLPTQQPTDTPVFTDTPHPLTATPITPTPTSAPTDTSVPTHTPEPTATPSPMPTNTPVPPTSTPAPTATPLPTETPVPPSSTPLSPTSFNAWTTEARTIQPFGATLKLQLMKIPFGCLGDNTCIAESFEIGVFEITNAQYRQCVNSPPYNCSPPAIAERYVRARDTLPVMDVTWLQASTYCGLIGGRLPTEQEWRYAASHLPNMGALVQEWVDTHRSDSNMQVALDHDGQPHQYGMLSFGAAGQPDIGFRCAFSLNLSEGKP
jgi:outer membrane biosynthesis protein TonB